jgi:hypothetical protein
MRRDRVTACLATEGLAGGGTTTCRTQGSSTSIVIGCPNTSGASPSGEDVGFTGSSGTHRPDDELARLSVLRELAD